MYPNICCPVLADGARYSYRSSNKPEEQKRGGRGEGGKLKQFPIFISLDAVHEIPTFTIPFHFGWISCFAHVAAA
jgi:hypothetical protein